MDKYRIVRTEKLHINYQNDIPGNPLAKMKSGEIVSALLDGIVTDPLHGYAILFEYGGVRLEAVNGLSGDGKGGEGEPITLTTRFRLASVTKQFIARAIVELVLSGKLSFEDKLGTFFEDLPACFASLTLRMLLGHTSGIPDYEDMPDDGSGRQILDRDVPAFLKTLDRTYFTPGSEYRYSNTAFVLLGLIIEKVSGKPIEEAMQELVFAPAGMTRTLVNIQGVTEIPERAYGHTAGEGKLIENDQYRWSATVGDGGIYSCISDLELWIDNMIANDGWLSGSMLKEGRLNDGRGTAYGMGIRLKNINGRRIICHTGETIGFNSLLMYSPELPLRLVFLTNCNVKEPYDVLDNAMKLLF